MRRTRKQVELHGRVNGIEVIFPGVVVYVGISNLLVIDGQGGPMCPHECTCEGRVQDEASILLECDVLLAELHRTGALAGVDGIFTDPEEEHKL